MNRAEKVRNAIANLDKAKRAEAHPKMITMLEQQLQVATHDFYTEFNGNEFKKKLQALQDTMAEMRELMEKLRGTTRRKP